MENPAEWKTERVKNLRELLMQLLFNPNGSDPELMESKMRKKRLAEVFCHLIDRIVLEGNLSEEEAITIMFEVLGDVARAERLMYAGDTEVALALVRGKKGRIEKIDPAVHGEADIYFYGQNLKEIDNEFIGWFRSQGLTVNII
jgi:hypothetical protein